MYLPLAHGPVSRLDNEGPSLLSSLQIMDIVLEHGVLSRKDPRLWHEIKIIGMLLHHSTEGIYY